MQLTLTAAQQFLSQPPTFGREHQMQTTAQSRSSHRNYAALKIKPPLFKPAVVPRLNDFWSVLHPQTTARETRTSDGSSVFLVGGEELVKFRRQGSDNGVELWYKKLVGLWPLGGWINSWVKLQWQNWLLHGCCINRTQLRKSLGSEPAVYFGKETCFST